MKRSRTKPHWPTPPEELDDEALLEWHRVCEELDHAGRLTKADRAVLHVYVELWALHRKATRQVAVNGFSVTYTNENVGLSPAYQAMTATARQLRTLLNDLGLTPAKRGTSVPEISDDLPNF